MRVEPPATIVLAACRPTTTAVPTGTLRGLPADERCRRRMCCEVCGASPVERVLYPVAVHFKGSGFYSTDYGSGAKKRDTAKEGDASSGRRGEEERRRRPRLRRLRARGRALLYGARTTQPVSERAAALAAPARRLRRRPALHHLDDGDVLLRRRRCRMTPSISCGHAAEAAVQGGFVGRAELHPAEAHDLARSRGRSRGAWRRRRR